MKKALRTLAPEHPSPRLQVPWRPAGANSSSIREQRQGSLILVSASRTLLQATWLG